RVRQGTSGGYSGPAGGLPRGHRRRRPVLRVRGGRLCHRPGSLRGRRAKGVDAVWEEMVGTRSPTVRNTVERGAVRRFADANGDRKALYLDEEVAAQSRSGRLLAPPTLPRVFDFGKLPNVPLPPSGIIHGDQSYTYTRPLFVGEDVDCHTLFKETYERNGSGGTLRFLVFERVADDAEGNRVLTTRDVYILTEKVAADRKSVVEGKRVERGR